MSYIKTNLNTGEKLKYHSRISIKPIIINSSFIIIVSFIAGYVITDWFLGLFLALIAIVILIPFALLAYFESEFGVSGKRVISKKGIISRNASEMNLGSIESVNVDQGIIERIINVGSLKISGRGTTIVEFKSIDDPIAVRKMIQNKK
tara:strand:- start:215 stop:658 length:444 start_codon:yes stop_codon:yes gene_type:complete